MKRILTVLLIFIGAAAQAQEDNALATIGNDVFAAGYRLVHDQAGADDVFMSGSSIRLGSAINGSAAIAGQDIEIDAPVGGDVYILGQNIDVRGPVAGDASFAAQDLVVSDIAGDLRAAAATVQIDGNIGGYAILGGETIKIYGTIAGDAHIAAMNVEFGDTASIGGSLYLYEETAGDIEVPAFVSVGGTVERLEMEEFPEESGGGFVLYNFLSGVAFVAVIAALFAAVAPQRLAGMRVTLLERPFGMLWLGFLGLSVVLGASIVSAMTIVGILLMPVLLVLAGLGAFVGYVVGAYALGVGLRLLAGLPEPDSLAARAVAALIGALSAAIIALAPFIGWLFVLAMTLGGIGALLNHLFRPRFFADS